MYPAENCTDLDALRGYDRNLGRRGALFGLHRPRRVEGLRQYMPCAASCRIALHRPRRVEGLRLNCQFFCP